MIQKAAFYSRRKDDEGLQIHNDISNTVEGKSGEKAPKVRKKLEKEPRTTRLTKNVS